MNYKQVFFLLIFTSLSFFVEAQLALTQFIKKTNELNSSNLQEKVFVHLDRTFYLTGETAWIKIYLVDGYIHYLTTSSSAVYVEIVDADKNSIIQTKVELKHGLGNGSFTIPAEVNSGNYLIRAYTNWMKNFSSDFYYQQNITIINPFRSFLEKPIASTPPLDIQFFPEGGQLVDGIKSKIACRVVNENGIGINYTGFIISLRGDTVARFNPLKSGIGNFNFTPDKAEQYKVIIRANDVTTERQFPTIEGSGFVIHVVDTLRDKLRIKVKSKGRDGGIQIFFIAHTRQIIKIATAYTLKNGAMDFVISKDDLGEGISHLTIFNSDLKPICERLVFIYPKRNGLIKISSDSQTYSTRNKITLSVSQAITVTDSANLSLSVFMSDTLEQNNSNILSSLLLSSDLKGNIENPAYYFSDDVNASYAIDNLMLTHGWSRFIWADVEKQSKSIEFLPELRGHLIIGKLKNKLTDKPVADEEIYLSYPDNSIQFYGGNTDATGSFLVETKKIYGKKKIIIQSSQPDSLVYIELNSPFSTLFSATQIPKIDLPSTAAKQLTTRSISMQVQDAYSKGTNYAQTIDNSTFYGKPFESYTLDDYTRFPVMEEVIREYVKGIRLRKKENNFIFRLNDVPGGSVFKNDPLVLLDGVPITPTHRIMLMDPLKIKSIDVMTTKYYLGSLSFDGIVSFKTYDGDLGGFELNSKTFSFDYEGLQAQKEFFSPMYETTLQKESRLPDARLLLYWSPTITLTNNEKTIEFFSSDQPGMYKAIIQGISQTGQPVVEQCSFIVKLPQ